MEIDSGPSPQPTSPGKSSKELSTTGLVSQTFNLWTHKLLQYVIMVGIVGLALTVVEIIFLFSVFGIDGLELIDYIGTSPIDAVFNLLFGYLTPEYLSIVLSLTLVNLLVYAVVAGAAIDYAVHDYETPNSGDISQSFSFASSRTMSLIGVQFIQSIIILTLATIAFLMLYVDVLIALALVVLVLYIAVRLAPSVAVVVIEEKSALAALGRSWQITSGLFWHVFLSQILIGIISFILSLLIAVFVGTAMMLAVPSLEIAVTIGSLVASMFMGSITYIFQAVLYKDLEARGTSGDFDWWK